MELFIAVAAAFLLLPGIMLVLIPGVPGVLYMVLLSVVFAFADHFSRLSMQELFILIGIYVLTFIVDTFAGVLGAKYGGASFRSVLFGVLGALCGTVLLPPLGGIAGLFIAVLISEWLRHGKERVALRAASFSVVGAVSGVLINTILAIIFFSSFIIFVFFLN